MKTIAVKVEEAVWDVIYEKSRAQDQGVAEWCKLRIEEALIPKQEFKSIEFSGDKSPDAVIDAIADPPPRKLVYQQGVKVSSTPERQP